MKHFVFVTFPRSGHHLVIDILKELARSHDVEFSYCEYYTCCKEFPCAHNCQIMKNHDFDLSLQSIPDFTYIVMYRDNPIEQLEAWYRFNIGSQTYNIDDCLTFIKGHSLYYTAFLKKWVDQCQLAITYDALIDNPSEIIENLFHMIYPNTILNKTILKTIISRCNVARKYIIPYETYKQLYTEYYNVVCDTK